MVMNYEFGRYRSINFLLVFAHLCITRFRKKFYNNMITFLGIKFPSKEKRTVYSTHLTKNRKVNCSGIGETEAT